MHFYEKRPGRDVFYNKISAMANANSEQPACRTDPFGKEEIQPPLKLKQVEALTADLDEKTVPQTLKKKLAR